MSTLAQIRTKVRRVTGRPSPQQITDAQIDDYVNAFYLYDMPQTLRLKTQESEFEFMTEANVGEYDLTTLQVVDGSSTNNAIDVYNILKPPVYIAGYQALWSESQEQFFRVYPQLAQINETLEGDGATTTFSVTLSNSPIIQGSVTVGTIDSMDEAFNATDVPTDRTAGTWVRDNTSTTVTGSINYITGALSVTFPGAIPSGNKITFTAQPYVAARPQSVLFYDNVLTLRPVPDASYNVKISAYKTPTALLASGDSPQLKQWWQYLAFGASKKIFEDSQDPDSLAVMMPSLKEQERLVLRRTLVQQTPQRAATIYSETMNVPQNAPWGAY